MILKLFSVAPARTLRTYNSKGDFHLPFASQGKALEGQNLSLVKRLRFSTPLLVEPTSNQLLRRA